LPLVSLMGMAVVDGRRRPAVFREYGVERCAIDVLIDWMAAEAEDVVDVDRRQLERRENLHQLGILLTTQALQIVPFTLPPAVRPAIYPPDAVRTGAQQRAEARARDWSAVYPGW